MLKKVAILIMVGILSVSIAGCGHFKKPFKHKNLKKKHLIKSELQLNTDVNSYAKYIKNMQEIVA